MSKHCAPARLGNPPKLQAAPSLAAFERTRADLDSLLAWLGRTPHDLTTAARAAGIGPGTALVCCHDRQLRDCPEPELRAFALERSAGAVVS